MESLQENLRKALRTPNAVSQRWPISSLNNSSRRYSGRGGASGARFGALTGSSKSLAWSHISDGGIARVEGLPNLQSEELVQFENDRLGMAFNLDPDDVGVILLDSRKGWNRGRMFAGPIVYWIRWSAKDDRTRGRSLGDGRSTTRDR